MAVTDCESVLGNVMGDQWPFAWPTSPTAEGASVESLAPTVMHVPEVVHATFCKGTSMLADGVPVTWGLTTAGVEPQPDNTSADAEKSTATSHVLLVLALSRLMTFLVFFRHAPLCRWY
jgi:hypothetical protein